MIEIVITDEIVGKALLFEKLKRQGKRTLVPTYRTLAKCTETGRLFRFAVTRDSSNMIFFGQTDRFGINGQCPPSKPDAPYRARPSILTSDQTFSLRMFEPSLSEHGNALIGQGDVVRTNIMIHRGPGRSMGCIQVAGGKKGHRRFEHWFKRHLKEDTLITIAVLPH